MLEPKQQEKNLNMYDIQRCPSQQGKKNIPMEGKKYSHNW